MKSEINSNETREIPKRSVLSKAMRFWIEQKLLMAIVLIIVVVWGIMTAPFDWDIPWLPRKPLPVDAIPDIGEEAAGPKR